MNIHDLDTPALVVDLDRLERNIARMADLVREGGKRLRPHVKTHKTPEVGRMQLAAGASGITVAKPGEAEAFADAGFDDIFLANQIVGSAKIERLLALARRVRLLVGVDSLDVAEPLSRRAAAAGLRIPVRLELDTGLDRAGLRTVEQAVALGKDLARLEGIAVQGVFTHEGHLARMSPEARRPAALEAAAKVRQVAAALRAAGIPAEEASVGSTPGARDMAAAPGIDEMRPGVYVYYDLMQVQRGTIAADDCALSVLTTVISRPSREVAITDGGTKTFSGDAGPEGSRFGLVTNDPSARFDWANEEHGHLDLRDATIQPRVGDVLRIVPWHACAAVNMHDTVFACRGERVEAVWQVAARGRIR